MKFGDEFRNELPYFHSQFLNGGIRELFVKHGDMSIMTSTIISLTILHH